MSSVITFSNAPGQRTSHSVLSTSWFVTSSEPGKPTTEPVFSLCASTFFASIPFLL